MPQARLERIIAVIGILAIVTLVTMIIPMWLRYRDDGAAAHRSIRPSPHSVTTTVDSTRPAATGTNRTPTVRHEFGLAATGGDCWLEVHMQSSAGKLLYQGLLTDGKTLTFASPRLWIRVGAGEHLNLTLDGKTLQGVPRGTADILVTQKGVQPATA